MSDHLEMMVVGGFLLMTVMVSGICAAACVANRRKRSSPRSAHVALESPSVRAAGNAFERRVALAIHEAEQGTRVCVMCDFTNVGHASSCVRCGSELVREDAAQPKSILFFQTRHETEPAKPAVPSEVHRRIRRRHEWTRRVNREGKLEWHHDDELSDRAFAGLPAYVLRSIGELPTHRVDLDAPLPLRPVADSVEESKSAEAGKTHANNEARDTTTVDDVANELRLIIRNQPWAILDAANCDASKIAFANTGRATAATGVPVDVATTSQLPFPTKLAHFITSVAGLVSSASSVDDTDKTASSRLSIRRDHLLADSISALATLALTSLRAGIRVDFVDEQGIDAGGVYREWFLLMNEAIISPDAGLFACVDRATQTFYLNPQSREVLGDGHLAHFLAAGRLLGRALLDGNVTGFHLALPLLKIILGQPVGLGDLEYFDPEAFKHLTWLLANDGVDALCLDFTVTEQLPDGTTRTVELVDDGAEMEVTDANKVAFVDAKLKYLLFTSVWEQLFALLTGVYEVVPAELLAIFDAEELDYVVSGSDEIDVDDWEANCLIPKKLVLASSLPFFWQAVRELSTEERRRLLQFATGSSRVPPGGFRALTSTDGRLCLFNFRAVQPSVTRWYLHSHTCFNRLDIPLHGSLKLMRQAVQAAVSSESTGFTTD